MHFEAPWWLDLGGDQKFTGLNPFWENDTESGILPDFLDSLSNEEMLRKDQDGVH